VRWEKRAYPFLRTSEFLWQEGHGAHSSKEDNWERVKWGIDTYAKIYRDFLAVDGLVGKKSESEKFAGADTTLTFESIMPDGKALQSCTSHDLGQNFSKALDIKFQDKDGVNKYVWQNSWGFSTRSIGGMILTHGDDNGLKLPPKIAPTKVVIIPIFGKKDEELIKYANKIKDKIEKFTSNFPGQVEIDDDSEKSFGWRINDAEIRGIPIRIEVGTREMTEKTITLSFRIADKSKRIARLEDIDSIIEEELNSIQNMMFDNSKSILESMITNVEDYSQFKEVMQSKRGFLKAYWCENKDCEEKIKEETKATTRCFPLDLNSSHDGKCVYCNKSAKSIWYFAQAY
jgi:prolyl-tRNA synthetase